MTQDDQRIDALPNGSNLNSYIINRVMGSGAFGITYLATHRYLDTHHVIKEYLPDCGMREHNRTTVRPKSGSDKELFDWGLKCFFDEAKLLHQLSHPHIVKVTDLFEANGTAYFVMPYLKGITLHEWMKQHTHPNQDQLEAVFVPLLEGLKYIHKRDLLHRDVKPENIYITENGHPVLIDFGSARIAIGQKSKALTQVLTPHFAPIEQYRSKGTFTPALDFYSFAACMYQAITGKLPDEAPERIEEDSQPKLTGSEYEKRYAQRFLQAIDKSLSVYAKDRHQDGFALQKDLVGKIRLSSQTDHIRQDGIIDLTEVVEECNLNNKVSQSVNSSKLEKQQKSGRIWTEPITGMEFVWVPGGTFEMGDVFGDGDDNEKPVHTVELDGFWLGKYPVIQAQWEKVTAEHFSWWEKLMGLNPSYYKGQNHPVEQVSWNDVQVFIKKMYSLYTITGFRLPTEAEWEYAARSGGKREKYAGGNNIGDVAWHKENTGSYFSKCTKPVGTKSPNGLGLHDMSGNVWEWVSDWYDPGYYAQSPQRNPQGPSSGTYRINRGGSWDSIAKVCRATARDYDRPDFRHSKLGFRLALSPGQ